MGKRIRTFEEMGYDIFSETESETMTAYFHRENVDDCIFINSNGEVNFGKRFIMTQEKYKALYKEMKKRSQWK